MLRIQVTNGGEFFGPKLLRVLFPDSVADGYQRARVALFPFPFSRAKGFAVLGDPPFREAGAYVASNHLQKAHVNVVFLKGGERQGGMASPKTKSPSSGLGGGTHNHFRSLLQVRNHRSKFLKALPLG